MMRGGLPLARRRLSAAVAGLALAAAALERAELRLRAASLK